MKINNLLKILAIPLSFLVLAFGIYFLWEIFNLPEREEFFAIVRSWFDTYGLWLVFFSALLEGILVFGNYYPGGTVIFWGVILASGDIFETVFVVAIICVALFIAYFANYMIGKYGWYKIFTKFGMRKLLEEKKEKVGRHLFSAIIGSYWMPNLASLTSTAAGILHLPLRKFLINSAIGVIVWNTFWGILVSLLGERAFDVISLKWALIIFAVWVVVALVKQKFDKKHETVPTSDGLAS